MSDDRYHLVHENHDLVVPVGWFVEHTGDSVHPSVANNSEMWWVFDTENENEPIALALVDPNEGIDWTPELHRIGVQAEYRRQGFATRLVARLLEEYDELEASCRTDNDANEFYEHTGWTHKTTRVGDPDLNVWTVTKDTFTP